eukprot:GHVL01019084.1.p1 GENE.GHVL01019084.1~~GHVL01019084.1.p1  ORF type:complete len:1023 (+),score=202.75 GHVL01019084.1:893-3961(+)
MRCCKFLKQLTSRIKISKMEGTSMEIDENLYSRQLGAYGFEAMGKLIQMKVLVCGLRGLGVEIAKNLILAGPKIVGLHDPAVVEMSDLGANFYFLEKDVGKCNRAECCAEKLSELNPHVSVKIEKAALNASLIEKYDIVVATSGSKSEICALDMLCRSKAVGFIYTECFGLMGSIFVDFGSNFKCWDKTGNDPQKCIIAGITQENPASVHLHTEKINPFSIGDHVVFREVEGMTELNNMQPLKIISRSKYSFTIDIDATKLTPYKSNGIVEEKKMPCFIDFQSFEDTCTRPIAPNEHGLMVADFSNIGHVEQLHIASQTILEYRDKHGQSPPVHNIDAINECVEIAKVINEKIKVNQKQSAVENIDVKTISNCVKFNRFLISPMCAVFGGAVAQEIVKYTGKFNPLHQCLYFDSIGCLPKDNHPVDTKPLNCRYDDQIGIFGKEFQEKISKSNIFIVGAGALGCELLKAAALIGVCLSKNGGKLCITDMDHIETSNLNRQFLFRKDDVGKAKSATACAAVKIMNPDLEVLSMEQKVGAETEEIFDDKFWNGQDVILNALDNVQARLYVDSRCVWYLKPLLESGTLGTAANVQVILPRVTQSYGDSQDPPEQSIPLCTLKHFPNTIDHTIQWGRDTFEGIFTNGVSEMILFLKDPQIYLTKLKGEGSPNTQVERLTNIKRLLLIFQQNGSLTACIPVAIAYFQEYFNNNIEQLLYSFPLDHVTREGSPFWSGPKRPPVPLKFTATEELHMDFVCAAANLLAKCMSAPTTQDRASLTKIAQEVPIQPFKPKQMRIKVNDNDTTMEGCNDDDQALEALCQEVTDMAQRLSSKDFSLLHPQEFEKDDDSNFHIDVITALANLRATNYRIPNATRHKVKMIAGKIVPALATTTAMVTGLVCLEMYKVLQNLTDIECYRNAFIHLSMPLWIFSEPLPPIETVDKDYDPIVAGPVRARPSGFTTWDKLEINIPDGTLKQLIDHVENTQKVEVMILSIGNSCIYNKYMPAHKERLNKKVCFYVFCNLFLS